MSTLQVANIQTLATATLPVINDSAGTEVGRFCRAFVNFDGTGTYSPNPTLPGGGKIRASFNITSVLKNATGDYSINLTSGAVPDANYSAVASSQAAANATHRIFVGNGAPAGSITVVDPTSSVLRIQGFSTVVADSPWIHVSIFR